MGNHLTNMPALYSLRCLVNHCAQATATFHFARPALSLGFVFFPSQTCIIKAARYIPKQPASMSNGLLSVSLILRVLIGQSTTQISTWGALCCACYVGGVAGAKPGDQNYCIVRHKLALGVLYAVLAMQVAWLVLNRDIRIILLAYVKRDQDALEPMLSIYNCKIYRSKYQSINKACVGPSIEGRSPFRAEWSPNPVEVNNFILNIDSLVNLCIYQSWAIILGANWTRFPSTHILRQAQNPFHSLFDMNFTI